MKELLSFTFALLFIACQNQPFSHLDASPASQLTVSTQALYVPETSACEIHPETSLDVVQELSNSEMPGFHYREIPKRSEFDFENGFEALSCASSMTSSDETSDVVASAGADAIVDVIARAESWQKLTEKWDVRPVVMTCVDTNALSNNPACRDLIFVAEEGKLFSSSFENDFSQDSKSESWLVSSNESIVTKN